MLHVQWAKQRSSQHCPVWIPAGDWDTGAEERQKEWKGGKKHFSWGQTQLSKIWLSDTSSISTERRQPHLSPCLECIACLQPGDEGDRSCPVPHIFLIGEKLELNLAWDTAVGLQEEVAREPGPAVAAAGKHCQQLLSLCWLCDGHRTGHGWAIYPLFSSILPVLVLLEENP